MLMDMIEDADLHTTLASDLLDILMIGVDSLSADALVALCNQILSAVKAAAAEAGDAGGSGGTRGSHRLGTGKMLEVVPKVLGKLESMDALSGDLDTGTAFKAFFLNKLCNMPWPPQLILPVADAFKAVAFTEEQFKFASAKLVRSLDVVSTEEAPPLVYQLLLLSHKGQRLQILRGILNFCAAQHDRSTMETSRAKRQHIIQAQGTILMHFSFAVKQDQVGRVCVCVCVCVCVSACVLVYMCVTQTQAFSRPLS